MSENTNDLLSSICNNYIKSETFKIHLNNITQPFIKTLLNEFGIYLYIFIFYILIGFFLHLGILIILIRFINNTNKSLNK